jgi:hypothetical protein
MRSIGRHREIDVRYGSERPHKIFNAIAQQWLATGEPQLANAQCDEQSRQPLDLVKRQQVWSIEEVVTRTEVLPRHAVSAPEVASVRHGDTQITQHPVAAVSE